MGHAMERNSELPRLRPVEMEGLILRCLSSIGQKIVADAIGVDESTLSRWKSGQIGQFCRFVSALGMQIAPPGAVLVERDYLFSVESLAGIGLEAKRIRPEPLSGVEL